ncbi:MAG: alanine:cation symporter family protein [Ruminococcaceae bacterium]|nr:alanine:cation symporter family protein [Oscillospiraceae bacterium]
MIEKIVNFINNIFSGPALTIPLGNVTLELSVLVILLIFMGIYFTIGLRFFPARLFPEMLRVVTSKQKKNEKGALSGWQALVVSTATRVGMGNLAGVVAAITVGGAGAVFWMWVTALVGASSSFVESVLAQKYKVEDPLYGGYKGGPAYYIHTLAERVAQRKFRYSIIAVLFAISALICWSGISQVVGNSVTEAFENAFHIKPLYTIIVLVAVSAVIVLRKKATVKVLDIVVPIMAACYFVITILIMVKNFALIPGVFGRIFAEAFGIRKFAGGTLGTVVMMGVQRGLFSNEAGSGSAPCAAATAETDDPAKIGLTQSLGVFIDTIIICSCTAFIVLLVPETVTAGLSGMTLLYNVMVYHLGEFGGVFIAITLWLFAFSTFIGVLFYARSNVSYLFGDKMLPQTLFKIFALAMLFVGGLASYKLVWTIGDIGIALMTVFNAMALFPLFGEARQILKDYEQKKKLNKK